MRQLPPKPTMTRRKETFSYPGEIEPEVRARRERLKMTRQQHFESLLAFDLLLEKAHILTGPAITSGKMDAWHLWQEIIAEFGNPKKEVVAYTEMFLQRLMERSMEIRASTKDQE